MEELPKTNLLQGEPEMARLYRALARDSKYAHFVRIPERICCCLDYFKVPFNRTAVSERLHSYYLFIGVVDDVLDSTQLDAGRDILNQVADRNPSFDVESTQSRAWLATEFLKRNIEDHVHSAVLAKLEELYQAVVRERNSRTLESYVEQRRIVGRLTAELSYLLISPLLESDREDLREFLQEVGEVGCLVDSSIDLRADHRLGLLSINPTLMDHLRLIFITLRHGIRISLRHPRLFGLFLEAMGDNCLDRLRSIAGTGNRAVTEPLVESRIGGLSTATETLSGVAWTKP